MPDKHKSGPEGLHHCSQRLQPAGARKNHPTIFLVFSIFSSLPQLLPPWTQVLSNNFTFQEVFFKILSHHPVQFLKKPAQQWCRSYFCLGPTLHRQETISSQCALKKYFILLESLKQHCLKYSQKCSFVQKDLKQALDICYYLDLLIPEKKITKCFSLRPTGDSAKNFDCTYYGWWSGL